jgi:L-seryl-tRNA(Ser) seleniumtransferase
VKTASKAELFRRLPSVDELLRSPQLAAMVAAEGQVPVAEAARLVLARLRAEINGGTLDAKGVEIALSGLHEAVERQLRLALQLSLRTVINATGVILHTNLGRAPLSAAALEHIRETASEYSNLEFDLAAGERGKRDVHVDRLFRRLLGGENRLIDSQAAFDSALSKTPTLAAKNAARMGRPPISTIVVNNNAAAVLLALNTLAEGGEVIVSRGELVEIGGSFRIPDVMAKSNVTLREVGTTNRTRIQDYERAINEKTRLFLRVHRSNFEITGFTEQPGMAELAELARKHKLPLMEDLGSGALIDLRVLGIAREPSVLDSLRAGVDVVSYSGDKLLGGPQAGMLTGRSDLIARMRSNSLFRALRVDKLTYAALEATLLAYVKHDHDAIPALRLMRVSKEQIGRRAEKVAAQIRSQKLTAEIIDGESVIGGGAAPSTTLPTRLIAITSPETSADELAARLRASDPPVISRVEDDRVLLDLRTVFPAQDEPLVQALLRAAS